VKVRVAYLPRSLLHSQTFRKFRKEKLFRTIQRTKANKQEGKYMELNTSIFPFIFATASKRCFNPKKAGDA
jgi:hypothetical protein